MFHPRSTCLQDQTQEEALLRAVIVLVSAHLTSLLRNYYNKGKCHVNGGKLLDLFGSYGKKPGLHHNDVQGLSGRLGPPALSIPK